MRYIRFRNQSKQVKLLPGGWGVQEQQLIWYFIKVSFCFTCFEVGHYFILHFYSTVHPMKEGYLVHKAGTWKQKSWKDGTGLLHGFFSPCLFVISSLNAEFSLRRKAFFFLVQKDTELLRNYGMSINITPLQFDCIVIAVFKWATFHLPSWHWNRHKQEYQQLWTYTQTIHMNHII